MGLRKAALALFLAAVLVGTISGKIHGVSNGDSKALLGFYRNISRSNANLLNWRRNTSVCDSWIGVTCDVTSSRVIALRLPGFGFNGSIQPETLGRLSALQILSLNSNNFSGSFPLDFLRLQNLSSLHLQFNNFSGPLPFNFSSLINLVVLDLSHNNFNGSISSNLANLTHLASLNLSNNQFSGPLPDVNFPTLQELNLANNSLTGSLPPSLQRFPASSFFGNPISSQNPKRESFLRKEPALLGIILAGLAVGFIVISLSMNSWKNLRKKKENTKKKENPSGKDLEARVKENALVFFEGSSLVFNLEDLLMASAEILGKGTVGISYRAVMDDITTVAVKRLKETTTPKRDYEQLMETVGGIRHENVAPLRAYYYSKEEKLVVYDYYHQGSVSSLLHTAEKGKMNWETRVKIATGAARGIAYIHAQNGGVFVHGNIRASNIFLNSDEYGCVSEAGLISLVSSGRTAGYRAPEVKETRRGTQASDVYSFGVFVLELLTGRSPVPIAGGEEVMHLVRWVNAVVREEWTSEVFDLELLRCTGNEEKMVEMLQVGMSCVAKVPQKRPKMAEVVKMMEGILGISESLPSENNLEASGSTSVAEGSTIVKEIEGVDVDDLDSPPRPR